MIVWVSVLFGWRISATVLCQISIRLD